MNKRGQNSTLTLIIVIVLGIAVLAILIFGFTAGWSNLWDKFNQFGGGKSNIDSVVSGCQVACDTKSESAYCDQERTVKFGGSEEVLWPYKDGDEYFYMTDEVKSITGTCNEFANGEKIIMVNSNSEKGDSQAGVTVWSKGDTEKLVSTKIPGVRVARCPSLCS